MSEILERLAIHLSQHVRTTQRDYLSICRRFLRTFPQPNDWTPEAVFVFLQELETSGWNPLSRQRAVTALRKLYAVYEKGFPSLPRGAFSLDILDQDRPMLTLEELVALVRASVRAPWPELAGMVALATVYGLRGGEIAVLRGKDLNLEAAEVRITTGKQNAVRVHGIPAAIRPVLHPENFSQARSSTEMWGWWHDLEARAGIAHRTRQGWHAVRRGVVAVLLDAGVPEAVLEPWMGWRASLGRMVRRYPLRGRQEMDQEVFSRHPLLAVWAEQALSTDDALFKYKIPSGTLKSEQNAVKVRAWGTTKE